MKKSPSRRFGRTVVSAAGAQQSTRGSASPLSSRKAIGLRLAISGVIGMGSALWLPGADASIVYKGMSSNSPGTSTSTAITINKPAGAQTGEVLVALIGGNNGPSATTISPPSGWTVINNGVYGSLNMAGFYHVVGAGDPSSWTWTTGASQRHQGYILRYSGVDSTTPMDVAGSAVAGCSSTRPEPPSLTTVSAGAKIIRAFTANDDTAQGGPPNNLVLQNTAAVNANTAAYSQGISDWTQAIAGATDPVQFDLSSSSCWRALTIALRPAGQVAGQLSGTVFHDYNGNGSINGAEAPLAGIVVKAYDASGNVASTTTGADGTYSLSASSGAPAALSGQVRVEFTRPTDGSLSYLFPTAAGGTTVQFANIGTGASDLDVGFNNPSEYCQDNPYLCTPMHINGDPNSATAPTGTLQRFPYNSSGQLPQTGTTNRYRTATIADKSEIGTTWGVAWQRSTETLYAASFLKRHAGMGPSGAGAIYKIGNASSATPDAPALFFDLDTVASVGSVPDNATRGVNTAPGAPNRDSAVYSMIAKNGLGDIDLSEDESKLYAVNLYDKKLYVIPTTSPSAANVTSYAIPDPGCVNGNWRPFGLKSYRGNVYVGGVCDAASGTTANLTAHVLKFNGATFSSVLSFPLNFNRGLIYNGSPTCSGNWRTWNDTFPGVNCAGFSVVNPQPVLSDIEFDWDGSMIIGFLDRNGHQVGWGNYGPNSGDNNIYSAVAGGDTLRAYNNGGTFVLEDNGTAGWLGSAGIGNNQGPGGGEFYVGDNIFNPHLETNSGGLAVLLGKGEVALTTMDPLNAGSGGVAWYSNTDGSWQRAYDLFNSVGTVAQTFGKSTGLGDLELLCDAAPLEIGNRVWHDVNHNGVQDPDEAVLPGVTVTLKNAAGTVIASAVTDANGNYYFSNGTGTSTSSAKYGLSGLTTNTNGFQLFIASADPGLNGLSATIPNNDATTDGDLRDSDGIVTGSNVIATFNTGAAGNNNHTYDFGFYSGSPTVEYSVGDKIFWDYNNDGVLNGADVGIPGVVVQLQVWNGTAWVQASDINGSPVANQTTDSTGFYLFEHLALNNPANPYRVVVVPANFSNPLYGALSSGTDTNDFTGTGNNKDHGIGTQPQSYGIVSPSFDLNGLPSGVYHLPTVDFGFTRKSINTAPDLAFTSAVSSSVVSAGDTVNYTLSGSTVAGAGQITKAPAMTETLPAGLTVAGSMTSFTSADGRWKCSVASGRTKVSCGYIGSLPVTAGNSLGQVQFPVTVGVGVSSGATLTATGSITKLTGEPSYTNNVHSVAVTVQ